MEKVQLMAALQTVDCRLAKKSGWEPVGLVSKSLQYAFDIVRLRPFELKASSEPKD